MMIQMCHYARNRPLLLHKRMQKSRITVRQSVRTAQVLAYLAVVPGDTPEAVPIAGTPVLAP